MNRKFDWPTIEKAYIESDVGLRELARQYGVTNHSLIMAQSKRNGWVKKREDFRARAERKALDTTADKAGLRIARQGEVFDNAVSAIDEAITQMRRQMGQTVKRLRDGVWVEEPLVVIRPNDVAILIDRLQILFGRPSSITEERTLGINVDTADADLLRAFVDATRGLAGDGTASRSPLPRTEDPGSG